MEHGHRGNENQRALEDGGEIFHLLVAIGVLGIRRLGREAQGEQRHAGGDNIDGAFERIRIQRDRARIEIGREFQPQNDDANGNAPQRNTLGFIETQGCRGGSHGLFPPVTARSSAPLGEVFSRR